MVLIKFLEADVVEAYIARHPIQFITSKNITNVRLINKSFSLATFSLREATARSLRVKQITPVKRSARLVNVIYSEGILPTNSIEFTLTNNDLINNELIKFHGLNSSVVDVTIISNLGVNVEVNTEIVDDNRVKLNFQHLTVNGIWKILIEK